MIHDSIGLGKDDPFHQPIKHLMSFRVMPYILMCRPADGNETTGVFKVAVLNRKRPSILALSRQKVLTSVMQKEGCVVRYLRQLF